MFTLMKSPISGKPSKTAGSKSRPGKCLNGFVRSAEWTRRKSLPDDTAWSPASDGTIKIVTVPSPASFRTRGCQRLPVQGPNRDSELAVVFFPSGGKTVRSPCGDCRGAWSPPVILGFRLRCFELLKPRRLGLLLAPELSQLGTSAHRGFHVLHGNPFKRPVSIMFAAKQVWCRQAHFGQA